MRHCLAAFLTATTLGLSTLMTAPTSFAHHGFSMPYATFEAYWVSGIVTEAYFGFPHAEVVVQYDKAKPPEAVEGAERFQERLTKMPFYPSKFVEIEFPQQQRFYSLDGVVEVGDRVEAIVYRGCKKPQPFRGQWIRLSNGETREAAGIVQREVKRCISDGLE